MNPEETEVARVTSFCNQWVKARAEQAPALLERLYSRQANLDITYRDRHIPSFLRPCFISWRQKEEIRKSSQVLLDCAEVFIERYRNDPSIRNAVELSPTEEEFALLEPRIQRRVVVARPDSFLCGDTLKYLEFNSDSPAGVAWTDLHEQVFQEMPLMKDLAGEVTVEGSQCQKLLMDAILAAFRDTGSSSKPVMAVVDWRDVATLREFYVVCDYFERHGVKAVVADPRDLRLEGNTLFANGTAINLVYRRVIIGELLQKREEPGVKDFLRAYREGLVCVVNPFCSKISGSKAFMAVLSDEAYEGMFSFEQNRVKRKHVPWTRVLREGRVKYQGDEQDLFEFARRSREHMVIKPTNGYGGKGVVIGREAGQSQWEDLLGLAAADPGFWTIQEYVQIPEETFPVLKPDLEFEDLKVNLNPYLFGGRYAGCFVRLSLSSIINVTLGGGMVPVFVLPDRS